MIWLAIEQVMHKFHSEVFNMLSLINPSFSASAETKDVKGISCKIISVAQPLFVILYREHDLLERSCLDNLLMVDQSGDIKPS